VRSRPTARSSIVAMLVACAATLAACGGSSPTASPPGPGDFAICKVVSKATAAYQAKQYTTWRLDMAQIGTMAASAHDSTIRNYALELKSAYDSPSTSTTSTSTTLPRKVTSKKGATKPVLVPSAAMGSLFNGLGGYIGLKNTCASLHH
jgi:hypothetical protein